MTGASTLGARRDRGRATSIVAGMASVRPWKARSDSRRRVASGAHSATSMRSWSASGAVALVDASSEPLESAVGDEGRQRAIRRARVAQDHHLTARRGARLVTERQRRWGQDDRSIPIYPDSMAVLAARIRSHVSARSGHRVDICENTSSIVSGFA